MFDIFDYISPIVDKHPEIARKSEVPDRFWLFTIVVQMHPLQSDSILDCDGRTSNNQT